MRPLEFDDGPAGAALALNWVNSAAASGGVAAVQCSPSRRAIISLALAAASLGLVVYSVRRRWLLAELLQIRKARGVSA